jgi:RHS repeat-associated protein
MSASTYVYNLDGAMTAAAGETFSCICRHDYTRLPTQISGTGGDVSLRYDSAGRRLHKVGATTVLYRNGVTTPHTPVEHVDGEEIIYLFTPTGQSVTRRADGYARVSRDHLRSVRTVSCNSQCVTACYGAYGESVIRGGELRRAFAGYEPDAETGLYNAFKRLYAPNLRMFVSPDPRLQNASPYPYCAGDPFNYRDPTGTVSAAFVSGIVSGLLVVAGVIITLVSGGLAFPGVVAAEPEADIALESLAELTMETNLATPMPLTVGGFAKAGAAFAFASALVTNGAELITKAAKGEEISAWQAVKAMLIEPIIAAVAGAVGGAFVGKGLTSMEESLRLLRVLAYTVVGAAAASAITSVTNTAMSGKLGTREGWDEIGITMGVSVGEAIVLSSFFGLVKDLPDTALFEWGPEFRNHAPRSLIMGERAYRFFKPQVVEERMIWYARHRRGAMITRRLRLRFNYSQPAVAHPLRPVMPNVYNDGGTLLAPIASDVIEVDPVYVGQAYPQVDEFARHLVQTGKMPSVFI